MESFLVVKSKEEGLGKASELLEWVELQLESRGAQTSGGATWWPVVAIAPLRGGGGDADAYDCI